MVADAPAVLLQHPDTILLALIYVFDAEPLFEGFQVEVGERLMRTVVLRTHEAVELAVVHIGQPLLKLRRLFRKPFDETVSYLVDLGVGELYALAVAHLDVVAVLVLADALFHIGHGIHKGMFQQGDTVVGTVIALDAILIENLGVLYAALDGVVVHALRVADAHVGIEQVGGVSGIDARGYPPLAEVEIQLVERNRTRRGLLQGGKGFFLPLAVRILTHPCLDALRLIHHIARDKAVFDFVATDKRIVKDTSFQLVDQFLAAVVRQGFHVIEVYAAVTVERSRESFFGRIDVRRFVERERYRMVEDVGLDELPVLRPLQREDVAPRSVHHQELDVRFGIERAIPPDELVVAGVQVLTLHLVLLMSVGFVGIEPLVSVTHGNIGCDLLPLRLVQIERVERRAIAGNVFQIADLITHTDGVHPDERTLAVVRLQ